MAKCACGTYEGIRNDGEGVHSPDGCRGSTSWTHQPSGKWLKVEIPEGPLTDDLIIFRPGSGPATYTKATERDQYQKALAAAEQELMVAKEVIRQTRVELEEAKKLRAVADLRRVEFAELLRQHEGVADIYRVSFQNLVGAMKGRMSDRAIERLYESARVFDGNKGAAWVAE
jgi:hypothetical protein